MKKITKYTPSILSWGGILGVIITSILTAKQTPKFVNELENLKSFKGYDLSILDYLKVGIKNYMIPISSGILTMSCIFGSNYLNKKQQNRLLTSLTLLNSSYLQFKNKVKEKINEETFEKIQEDILKERYDEFFDCPNEKEQLFYDEYGGRYFTATLNDVLTAEYEIIKKIRKGKRVALNDLYEKIDIPVVDFGYDIGWQREQIFQNQGDINFEFRHHPLIMPDGMNCCIISATNDPMLGYDGY